MKWWDSAHLGPEPHCGARLRSMVTKLGVKKGKGGVRFIIGGLNPWSPGSFEVKNVGRAPAPGESAKIK